MNVDVGAAWRVRLTISEPRCSPATSSIGVLLLVTFSESIQVK